MNYLRRLTLILLLISAWATTLFAQLYPTIYRPPVEWMELKTDHFQIIYPKGEERWAKKAGRIMEAQFDSTKKLMGNNLNNMPLILNNYNARSNGFVTSLNFRMEVDMVPAKGKSLNPRTGGWFENVLPHEMIHAHNFEIAPEDRIVSLFKPFAPDLIRSIHGAAPSGLLEGIAVYHETKSVAEHGGRGNYPFFTNRFNAVFTSNDRWSLEQMTFVPSVARPFNRFYIGGYEFTDWLQEEHGEHAATDAIRWHFRRPLFLYGNALYMATRKIPKDLYRDFEVSKKEALADWSADHPYFTIDLPVKGEEIRRPKWISDQEIIFHGRFYDKPGGFYRYHLESRRLEKVKQMVITEDYRYHWNPATQSITYGTYKTSKIYDRMFFADLYQTSLKSKNTKRLTKGRQLYAPEGAGNGQFYVIQPHGDQALPLLYQADTEKLTPLLSNADAVDGQFIAMAANRSAPEELAVVINKNGIQGLWVTTLATLEEDIMAAPDVAFEEGSVFDPLWHPKEAKILFSSDHTGSIQLYEYEPESDRVVRLTQTQNNIFEGDYNSDGSKIVAMSIYNNLLKPVLIERSQLPIEEIPESLWKANRSAMARMDRPRIGHGRSDNSYEAEWTNSSYRSGLGWLKPRIFLPAYFSEFEEFGVYTATTDRLQRNALDLYLGYTSADLFYNVRYEHSGFFPGFRLSAEKTALSGGLNPVLFNRDPTLPSESPFRFVSENYELTIPVRLNLKQNIFLSQLLLEPSVGYNSRSIIDFDRNRYQSRNFREAVTVGNFAQLSLNLQQNVREMQPGRGLELVNEITHELDYTINSNPFTNATFRQTPVTQYRIGAFFYQRTIPKWHQSLRLGLQYFQSNFDETGIGFASSTVVNFDNAPFFTSNQLLTASTRYTIPFLFPDNGFFNIPFFFDAVYLSLFQNTVFGAQANELGQTGDELIANSRSFFGGGIRFRMKFSNLTFDFGVGVGLEPSRNSSFVITDF